MLFRRKTYREPLSEGPDVFRPGAATTADNLRPGSEPLLRLGGEAFRGDHGHILSKHNEPLSFASPPRWGRHYRGQPAKNMAHSMKNDVEKSRRSRSAVTGKYVTKAAGKQKKK